MEIKVQPMIHIGRMYITEILAHKRWQVFRKKSSNISAFVHENLSGIGIVQSFTAEKESEKEIEQKQIQKPVEIQTETPAKTDTNIKPAVEIQPAQKKEEPKLL